MNSRRCFECWKRKVKITFRFRATTHSRNKSNGATSETKSTGRGRFGGARGGKPLQEEVEETQREEVQVKPKPYRRG